MLLICVLLWGDDLEYADKKKTAQTQPASLVIDCHPASPPSSPLRCSLFARPSEALSQPFTFSRFLPEYDSNDFIFSLAPPLVSPPRVGGRCFKQCHRQPDQRHQCPHPTIRHSTLLSQRRDQFFCERSQSCPVDLYSSDARLYFFSGMSCLLVSLTVIRSAYRAQSKRISAFR